MTAKTSSTTTGARPSEGSSKHDEARLPHQAAGDRQHLLLAAGERAGALPPPLGEPREERQHALERRLGAGARARHHGAHLKVLADRHGGEDLAAFRPPGRCRDRRCGATDSPAISRPSKAIAPRRGRCMPKMVRISERLAGAVRADDGDDLARGHLERDVVERLGVAVEEIEIRDTEHHARARVAEIALDDLRGSRATTVRRALADLLPVMAPRRWVRKRHHRAHDVLGQQDGEPGLRERDRAKTRTMASISVGRSPAITSSSSSSLRPRRERARRLEPLALRQRQARGGTASLFPRGRDASRTATAACARGARRAVRLKAPTMHVIEHGQRAERAVRSGRCGRCRRRKPEIRSQAGDVAAGKPDRDRGPGGRRRRSD